MLATSETLQIGFMQGRLSPLIKGRIQAFPWGHWQDEFFLANQHRFPLMEWTLDSYRLDENPLMTTAGRKEIARLGKEFSLSVKSVTCDFVMEEPFYKCDGQRRAELFEWFKRAIDAMAMLEARYMVVPLVDNGRIEDEQQESVLREGLGLLLRHLEQSEITILFESDFPPLRLSQFIESFDPDLFGINYDIGNSASLGFDPVEEMAMYGQWIHNVHVKDRLLGGTTVPLGEGNADLSLVCGLLANNNYQGNLILQTARAQDETHVETLCNYRDVLVNILEGEVIN